MSSPAQDRTPTYGCIVVAQFAAQAMLRLRPQLAASAVVVMSGLRPHGRVHAANVRAGALGLHEGMTQVEVETFGAVEILQRSSSEEHAAQQILLEATSLFSPSVEPLIQPPMSPHWECLLDLSGTERLLGSPETVGHRIIEQLQLLGFAAHIAICSNPDAGLSLACFAANHALHAPAVQVIPAGQQLRALAPLPLHVLHLEDDVRQRFETWGITTLAELGALPEIDLIKRMGQAGKRLRLRARGEMPHLLQPRSEAFRLEEVLELEESIETLEPLLFLFNSMLEQILVRAQSHALAIAAVTVTLLLQPDADRDVEKEQVAEAASIKDDKPAAKVDKPAAQAVHERTIQPAVPTVDRPLLLKMLQLDLEAHPPPGAVIQLRLTAKEGDTSRIQLALFAPPMPEATRFEDTHARLIALVGEGNVGRARPLDTHAPDTFALERFKLPGPLTKASPPRARGSLPATSMRRMQVPVEVRVSVHERKIQSFIFEAQRFQVLRCYGPWRASGDWWNSAIWSFDTWDVAARAAEKTDDTEAELLICRIGHDLLRRRWQMEGFYD